MSNPRSRARASPRDARASGTPDEPGSVHLVNSSLFEYRGSVDITQQVVIHGSLKLIMVKDGQVGISYNDGVLEMLEPGRHKIEKGTHVFYGFVSTGQQTVHTRDWRASCDDFSFARLRFLSRPPLSCVSPRSRA